MSWTTVIGSMQAAVCPPLAVIYLLLLRQTRGAWQILAAHRGDF